MMSLFDRLDMAPVRRKLGRFEDQAAGWAWDAKLPQRVDHLLVLIEAAGA